MFINPKQVDANNIQDKITQLSLKPNMPAALKTF
jgi:hypothetical protein